MFVWSYQDFNTGPLPADVSIRVMIILALFTLMLKIMTAVIRTVMSFY